MCNDTIVKIDFRNDAREMTPCRVLSCFLQGDDVPFPWKVLFDDSFSASGSWVPTVDTEPLEKKRVVQWSLRKVGRTTAFGGAGQGRVCQRWKCELLQEWESERSCDGVLVAFES